MFSVLIMPPVEKTSAGKLNEGSTVLIEDEPCRIKDISRSKPGKHGSTKVRIKAEGIIDGKSRNVVWPSDERVDTPIIEKKTAQVLSVSDDKVNVMDQDSYQTFDLEIPDNLEGDINEGDQVLFWEVMDTKLLKKIK